MNDYTPTYLLTWNPKKYNWCTFGTIAYTNRVSGYKHETDWSCRSKKPKKGDKFIMLLQGMGEKNGVVGWGRFTSEPYELGNETVFGSRFINILFYEMWNYQTDDYVKTSQLKELFPEQCFSPQFSGMKVKASILPELWRLIEGSRGNGLKDCSNGF